MSAPAVSPSALGAIGNTPLVELRTLTPVGAARVFLKLEYYNPTGSYKDRMAIAVIENAERMGLAQLHQLRGRVGRGEHASSCVLLYRAPLSGIARERLGVMRATNDGFEVARRDLDLRGPGEFLGTRQTGLAQMRVADLQRDADLLPRVQLAAEAILRDWPEQIAPLVRRWVGLAEQYGRVG